MKKFKIIKMKNIILLILFITPAFFLNAQQENHFTQFYYNKMHLNPGYAGSRGLGSITALYRNQWIGFEGAPEAKVLTFDMPIARSRVGFGLNLSQHTVGIMNNFYGTMAYNYNIPLDENISLRVGMQAVLRYFTVDFSDPSVITRHNNDLSIPLGAEESQTKGDVGLGAYLNAKDFYVGISVPHLLKNEITFNSNTATLEIATELPHIYAMAGALIPFSEKFGLRPSMLVKYVNNAPLDVDINLSGVFNSAFIAGIAYRVGGSGGGESIDFNLFYQFEKFGLGAAYDLTLSDLKDYNNGSIEALIRYDFKKEKGNMANPRFFF